MSWTREQWSWNIKRSSKPRLSVWRTERSTERPDSGCLRESTSCDSSQQLTELLVLLFNTCLCSSPASSDSSDYTTWRTKAISRSTAGVLKPQKQTQTNFSATFIKTLPHSADSAVSDSDWNTVMMMISPSHHSYHGRYEAESRLDSVYPTALQATP